MADNLKIVLSTGFDFTNGNNELDEYIKKINKNTKLKFDVDTTSLKNNLSEVSKQIEKSTKFTSQGNINAYWDNYIKRTQEYKLGIMDVTTYLNKLQQIIYKSDGSKNFASQFDKLDYNKQQEMVNSLKLAYAEYEKINKEIDITRQKIQQKNEKETQYKQILSQELEMFKTQQNLKADTIEKRYKNIGNTKSELDNFRKSLNSLEIQDGKLVNTNNQTITSFKQMRQELSNIRTTAQNSMGVLDTLKDNLSKFSQYFFMGGAVTSTVEGFKQFISYSNEMDKYLTNVQIITGQTKEEVSGLTQEYINLGKELGMLSQDIAKISEEFYRQGMNASDTQQMIKMTSQMATLSGMEMSEATERITAIKNGYKMSVEEVSHAIDAMVQIDNSGAIRCYLKRIA